MRVAIGRRATASIAPIALGAVRIYVGDSQTAGRAEGSTASPITALDAILSASGIAAATEQVANGVSGRSLVGTNTYYTGETERLTATLVYFQESGDQNTSGQTTASAFGDTFDDFITEIIGNTPNAVIVVETAFSFGREATAFRNWDAYNTELRARVAAWALLGTTIYISEVDRNIKALQTALTPGEVWFQSVEENAYHYKGPGNYMVALSFLEALHYDIPSLDHSGILEPAAPQKAACLQVIADNL